MLLLGLLSSDVIFVVIKESERITVCFEGFDILNLRYNVYACLGSFISTF